MQNPEATNTIQRGFYRYAVYRHRLMAPDGQVYARPFIVIKNDYGVIVRFTTLHDYVGIFEGKVFVPFQADATAKLHYVCKMLNYVLIERFSDFGIDHVFDVGREMLEQFFRDYAEAVQPNGEYRSAASIEKCVAAVTSFFWKLRHKHGDRVLLAKADLVVEKLVYNKYRGNILKPVPSFQVRGMKTATAAFRELPTKAFKILMNLAFRYSPDIAFAMCLQAFAGLRAGEVCNIRQGHSPLGRSLTLTKIGEDVRKVEIDLTRELPMRSDGLFCGRIKKERVQCVYPQFLDAFMFAYLHHEHFLTSRQYEADYCPMFVNERGMAMTYPDYGNRFKALVEGHFRPALLSSGDPECRIYGQLLYENSLVPQSLRHWYSVQLVLRGEDIAQIQYWRGDSSPESALTYLQNKGDLIRELELAGDELMEMLLSEGEREANGIDGLY